VRTPIRPRSGESLAVQTRLRSSRCRVEAAAPLVMRVALGIVFIWFGALKIANVTPVATLVADTLAWVPVNPDILLPALGAFEIVLGAMVIIGWHLRLVLTVLIAHLCGTFLVLVVLPQAAFERGNPLLLTTIGEFVVKNVVFIAAALLLAAWPRTAPGRRHDGDVSTT
jgi:putative oxidoreductase